MRRSVLWIVGVVVVAGAAGGYYGWTRLGAYSGEQFRAQLDQTLQRLPPGYAITYKTAEYSVPTNRATLTGVTIKGTGTQVFDATIDEVDVDKPSADFAAAWAQATANPAALAPDKALPVAGSILVKGVTLHLAPTASTVASARVDGLRLYPWALLHAGVPSWTEAQAVLLNRTKPPELAEVMPLLRLEAAILLGFGYDKYSAQTMQVTAKVPPTPESKVTDVTYTIRELGGSGYDRGLRGEAEAQGIDIQLVPLGRGSIEKVSMTGFQLQKPLNQLLEAQEFKPEMLDGFAIGKIEYAGMKALTPDGKEIPIGTLSISKIGFSQGVPISGELAYGGLKLSKALMPDPQAQEAFDKLGVETLTLSLAFSYQWDLDQKRIALKNVALKVDELGALNLTAELSEMTPGAGWQTRGSFVHALLRYDDASLAERALKAAAQQTNTDPTALRQQLIALVGIRAAALGNSPAITAAAKAVTEFLGAPHSLTIELAPASPVTFLTLQTAAAMPPGDIATLIGLAVTANK